MSRKSIFSSGFNLPPGCTTADIDRAAGITRDDDETIVTRKQRAYALLDDCANTLEASVNGGDFGSIEDVIDDIRTARQWLVEEDGDE